MWIVVTLLGKKSARALDNQPSSFGNPYRPKIGNVRSATATFARPMNRCYLASDIEPLARKQEKPVMLSDLTILTALLAGG